MHPTAGEALLDLALSVADAESSRHPASYVGLLGTRCLGSSEDLRDLVAQVERVLSRDERRWVLYLDPVVTPRSLPGNQVSVCAEGDSWSEEPRLGMTPAGPGA